MAWDGMVPFADGVMLEYEGDVRSWMYQGKLITYVSKADPFVETLTYESCHKGRSAVRFIFRGESGREFSLTMSALDKCLPHMDHGVVRALWRVAKQGQNFTIDPVRFEGDAA